VPTELRVLPAGRPMNEPRGRLLPLIAAVGAIVLQAAAVVLGAWAIFVWLATA